MRIPTWGLALVAPVIAGVAVAVTFAATDAPSATAGDGSTIEISNFEFEPKTITVAAGATVKVVNSDGAAHTVTAENDQFDTGNIEPGDDTKISASKPGTNRYYCAIHDYMRGTLKVR